MTQPFHADDYERVLTEMRNAPSLPDLEQEKRASESGEIRSRIPGFLRGPKGSELLERVSAKPLKQSVSAWRIGAASLVLLGATKIGKTTAAGWLFRRLVFEGVKHGGSAWDFARRLAWFDAEELSRSRREHPLGKGDAREIVEASTASLLFLDDAGWDRDPEAVSVVLNARYKAELPTLVTSGKTTDELTAHYGAAVVRRMLESGGKRATVVDCFPKPGEQGRLV